MQNSIKIISISGLDGSGKTTQVQMLKNYLEQQGKKVFYFHAIEFSIANKINNFFKSKKNKSDSNLDKENIKEKVEQDSGNSVTKTSWLLIQMRKIFLIIDIFRFKKFLKKIKKQGYTHLVTDRYFYDSIINIEYLTQNLFSTKCEQEVLTACSENEKINNKKEKINFPANTQTCLVIRIIGKIIPRPNKAFYLSVSPNEIITRDRIPEQGLDYLKIKNVILNQNFSKWNLQKIIGKNSKEKVFQMLRDSLNLI